MANSYSVVSIDQSHFDSRLSGRRIGRKAFKKKLYSHTTSHSSKNSLSIRQIERLIEAAMNSPRSGFRDAALILLAYKHGLKVSELRNLKWQHIDFENQNILISRLQNGRETFHTLDKRELELLHQLENDNTEEKSELVFTTQRHNKMSSTYIGRIIKQAGELAGFKNPVYPSMVTGASGFEFMIEDSGERVTSH